MTLVQWTIIGLLALPFAAPFGAAAVVMTAWALSLYALCLLEIARRVLASIARRSP